jgi:hypothetical protein
MSICYVIINTAQSQPYTERALRSFVDNTVLGDDDRWILIDNDSSWCDALPQRCEIWRNAKPQSYAENANLARDLALHHQQGVCISNNDIWFLPHWNLDFQPHATHLTVPNSNEFGELRLRGSRVPFPTDLEHWAEDRLCVDSDPQPHGDRFDEPLHVSFCCVHIPRDILLTVGRFDEDFVNGAEDVDFRLRALLQGHATCRARQRFVLHFGGKSTWQAAHSWDEIRQRNQLYTQAFQHKWGHTVTRFWLCSQAQVPDADLLQQMGILSWQHHDHLDLLQRCQVLDRRLSHVLYQ